MRRSLLAVLALVFVTAAGCYHVNVVTGAAPSATTDRQELAFVVRGGPGPPRRKSMRIRRVARTAWPGSTRGVAS